MKPIITLILATLLLVSTPALAGDVTVLAETEDGEREEVKGKG